MNDADSSTPHSLVVAAFVAAFVAVVVVAEFVVVAFVAVDSVVVELMLVAYLVEFLLHMAADSPDLQHIINTNM
jgi:hypothetical protein